MTVYVGLGMILFMLGAFSTWGYLQTRHDEKERKRKSAR